MLICVESPYRGFEHFAEYLSLCFIDVMHSRHTPIASHAMYTTVLNDENAGHRAYGLYLGQQLIIASGEVWVYNDFGVSDGMKSAMDFAERQGKNVVVRTLRFRPQPLALKPHLYSPPFNRQFLFDDTHYRKAYVALHDRQPPDEMFIGAREKI